MKQILLAAALIVSMSAECSTGDIFSQIRNGFQPTLHGNEREDFKNRIRMDLAAIDNKWEHRPERANDPEKCLRFGRVLKIITSQLRQSLDELHDVNELGPIGDNEFLTHVRLRLLIPAFFELHALFSHGKEGGYGTLDAEHGQACSFSGRALIMEAFNRGVRDLSDFDREALGNPGILGMDKINDRLIDMSSRYERHMNHLSWGALGLATTASLLLWEFAPPMVLAAARGTLGIVPALFRHPGFIFALRSAGLATEGLAFHSLDNALDPEFKPHENVRGEFASWSDQLESIEKLATGGHYVPDLYLFYFGQVEAQLGLIYVPWLKQHQKELNIADVEDIYSRIEEAIASANHSLEERSAVLIKILNSVYGFEVECQSGWWAPYPAQCVRGLRSLARTFYRSDVRPAKNLESVLKLVITSGSADIIYDENSVELEIPHTMNSALMGSFVNASLVEDGLRSRIANRDRFHEACEAFQANVNAPVIFDRQLSMSKKWRALNTLISLAKNRLDFLTGPEEVFYVSNEFASLREVNMQLQLGLAADATVAEMRRYINYEREASWNDRLLHMVRSNRGEIEKLSTLLKTRNGVIAGCSDQSTLDSGECHEGLEKIERFFAEEKNVRPITGNILVVASDEISNTFELTSARSAGASILRVKYDFQIADLVDFSNDKGWLP